VEKRLQVTPEVEVQNLESSTSSKESSEKEILLDEYDEALRKPKNISVKSLLLVYTLILLALALILPKIYISNQIYYISKNINTKYHTYTALKEENEHLKRELELMRYQVEVIDELE
jgi:cell division protein FtsB